LVARTLILRQLASGTTIMTLLAVPMRLYS
jgi:hypothetical protein